MTQAPFIHAGKVLSDWIDYNGHMTESRYLHFCSQVTDGFLVSLDVGPAYVDTGYSYYTAETHIRHRAEAKEGEPLTGRLFLLEAEPRRLHVFVEILSGERLLATVEQMLVHVDMRAARAVAAPTALMERLLQVLLDHTAIPRPEGIGRSIGMSRQRGA